MDLGLFDKRALVTGASRGLGFAIARGLVREGARVAINSRSKENLIKATEELVLDGAKEVVIVEGDLQDVTTPEKIIKQAATELGGLDLLVTNAGGPPTGKFENLDDTAWLNAVDLTLMSHVRLIRTALPFLRESSSASVLTMTSYSVKQPIPNLVLSNSIRSATVGLTKTLALELGSEGIRFNSILPGWTATERVKELMRARAEINQSSLEEEIQKQAAESPFERMATPTEVAHAAIFLLSPAASYITGVMLSIDGGMYKGMM